QLADATGSARPSLPRRNRVIVASSSGSAASSTLHSAALAFREYPRVLRWIAITAKSSCPKRDEEARPGAEGGSARRQNRADGGGDVLAKIAEMPNADREMAERVLACHRRRCHSRSCYLVSRGWTSSRHRQPPHEWSTEHGNTAHC